MKIVSAVLSTGFKEGFGRVMVMMLVTGSLLTGCATLEETLDGFGSSDTAEKEDSGKTEASSASDTRSAKKTEEKQPTSKAEPKDDKKSESTLYKPAPGSKFSKVKIGMSYRRVLDIIGDGTDYDTYTTGKAWIPFYYGSDRWRKDVYYKKEGRLVFNSRDDLIEILVDTDEDGYR
ncbi:MAG: hypothetical protein KUG72_01430 [Pseudomonadales bacterium]|nr:hypothetical protein [Pseudomonadales bacterium]